MKKTLALALAATALFGALAGCGARGARQERQDTGTSVQQPPAQPGSPTAGKGAAAVDPDLDSVNALLRDVDDDLANADKTPEDAD